MISDIIDLLPLTLLFLVVWIVFILLLFKAKKYFLQRNRRYNIFVSILILLVGIIELFIGNLLTFSIFLFLPLPPTQVSFNNFYSNSINSDSKNVNKHIENWFNDNKFNLRLASAVSKVNVCYGVNGSGFGSNNYEKDCTYRYVAFFSSNLSPNLYLQNFQKNYHQYSEYPLASLPCFYNTNGINSFIIATPNTLLNHFNECQLNSSLKHEELTPSTSGYAKIDIYQYLRKEINNPYNLIKKMKANNVKTVLIVFYTYNYFENTIPGFLGSII